jgi:hypothetical protein
MGGWKIEIQHIMEIASRQLWFYVRLASLLKKASDILFCLVEISIVVFSEMMLI